MKSQRIGEDLVRVSPRYRAGMDIASERTCDFRPQEIRRMAADVAVETGGPLTRSGRSIHSGPDDHARIQNSVNDGCAPP